jgi:hypothetical protein
MAFQGSLEFFPRLKETVIHHPKIITVQNSLLANLNTPQGKNTVAVPSCYSDFIFKARVLSVNWKGWFARKLRIINFHHFNKTFLSLVTVSLCHAS